MDGKVVTRRSGETSPSAVIGRSRLTDGPHVVQVDVTDWVGNVGSSRTTINVDSRSPRVKGLRLAHPGMTAAGADAAGGVRATVDVRDYGPVRLDLTLARLAQRIHRTVTVAANGPVTIPVGPLAVGRYAVTLTATDRAGNANTTNRVLAVTA